MISAIPERVKASSETIVKLTLQPEPSKVEVSPGSSGIVTLTGTVYCLKYGPDEVRVSLTASSDACGANVIPPNMVFGGTGGSEETRSFAVTTRVPMGTLFGEIPSVTVSGSYLQGNIQYPILSATQIIEIEPYYELDIMNPPPQEMERGEIAYIPVKITNMGNIEDTYEFMFDNIALCSGRKWTVATITPKTFQPNEIKTYTVSIQEYNREMENEIEIFRFNLRIISQQATEEGGNVKYIVPIYLVIRDPSIPIFIPFSMLVGAIFVTMVFAWRGWDHNKKVRGGDT
jgi:hypothetical protein